MIDLYAASHQTGTTTKTKINDAFRKYSAEINEQNEKSIDMLDLAQ